MANHLDLEEQEQLDQIKHFWSTWGTLITGVLVVVAGCVVAWNGYQYWQSRQSTQAAALFDAVDAAVRSADAPRVEQALSDLKSRYGSTVQAGQAGLNVAKFHLDVSNPSGAKDTLAWVAEKSSDDGLKALANLRHAAILMGDKDFEMALKLLSLAHPPEFDALFADRRGDLLVLQGKNADAVAEYSRALKGIERGLEYRRLIEIKLGALGAAPSEKLASLDTKSVRVK